MDDYNPERDAEDADKLLYADISNITSMFGLDSHPTKVDHCDLLLNAIDAQLDQLQVQLPKCNIISRQHDRSTPETALRWSQPPSKEIGLGRTTLNDAPLSGLDLMQMPTMEQKSENKVGHREGPVTHKETNKRLDRITSDKEESQCRTQQVTWRLERLLGGVCEEGKILQQTQSPSDSICTEDFVSRFKEEMVELSLSDRIQQISSEENAETTDASGSDTCLSDRHQPLFERGKSPSDELGQGQHHRKCLSENYDVNMSHLVEDGELEKRSNTPQRSGDNNSGMPVWSFGSLSIESDFDTDSTDRIRKHTDKLTGCNSLLQCVVDMKDHRSDQNDPDTPTQAESEAPAAQVRSSSHGCSHDRSLSASKAQRHNRETYNSMCSLSDLKDTHEEINHWSRTSKPLKTWTDWAKMEERHWNLKRERRNFAKCEKDEETLRLKRSRIKDAELWLSKLQEERKLAMQQLERQSAETTRMDKDKRILESVLRERRAEKESVSCQLQRHRDVCLLKVRDPEEALATLHQCKQTLKEESCTNTSSAIVSVLERQEMERQLDNTKTELFAEQRRAREKIEYLEEKLEESHEELDRSTETESSLRNRCACLEEKQIEKTKQIEALEVQQNKLQHELEECKIRVAILDQMLAQKELQLLGLQEHCWVLQAERDELQRELEPLKAQHVKELKEAPGQAHSRMQAKEEEVNALSKETLVLTQDVEFKHTSPQQKDKEIIGLRTILQQEREAAKKREKELQIEILEKVHKAVEEERRKCEAEQQEAAQVYRRTLEEQLENLRSEMERERSKSLALQHQMEELKTQNQKTVQRPEDHVQLAVNESDRLKAVLEETERSHKLFRGEMEQQLRRWAKQLTAEYQQLHLLVEQSGAKQRAAQLPLNLTVAEALAHLRTLREEFTHFINHLQQELDSQKQSYEQLRKDKDQELHFQKQQLWLERDQALNSVKERLIQEHIEELSSLNWGLVSGVGAEGGAAASLRRQLRAKDLQLRQVQKSMTQWREQTAARLACKFEEEMTAELERCKARFIWDRKHSKSEAQRRNDTWCKCRCSETEKAVCSLCIHGVDSACSYIPSDTASLKLLCFLQSRVKQLSVENQNFTISSR